jgi:hypothetical protein
MKDFVEILPAPICINEGNKFLATAYPGSGLYEFGGSLLAVNGSTVFHIGAAASFPRISTIEEAAESVVTTSDLLKAIAIAQQPTLARELLK